MPESRSRAKVAVAGFLGFIGLSVVAGVLATAAVTPAIAATGLATNTSITLFDGLPDYLQLDALAQKSNIYAKDSAGNPVLLASFYDQNRIEVGWDKISQYVKDAAVSAEDPRFYDHGGVDLMGTVRAVLSNVGGGDIQGGSSITQQYVKNVLVQKAEAIPDKKQSAAAYKEATDTTPERKLKEMRLAIGLEKTYGKDDILRGYLNIAGFGGRVYGIEAAANYYFNTTAANLTLDQAATLVAIVNNPENLRIDKPDDKDNGSANGYALTKARRDYVLKQMHTEGKITQAELEQAKAQPITPSIVVPVTGCQAAGSSAYFCDYVTHILQNNAVFGATQDARWANFTRGGYSVYTTLDVDLQNTSQAAIDEYVPKTSDQLDIGAVSVSVQPGTGRILAMAQNKDYSQDPEVLASGANYSAINYNTDSDYGGSSGFQPGSTYKIFTLTDWLAEGHGVNETINANRRTNWGTFNDSCAPGGTVQADAGWNPQNDEGESGNWTVRRGTEQSVNTVFVGMAKQLDLCAIRKTAESMGVHRADGDPLEQGPASVLGTNEIAPLTMAGAFATLASGGTTCDPIAIDSITKPDGSAVTVPAANCRQSVDPKIAAAVDNVLQGVVANGTASASGQRTTGQGELIGKTGTTDNAEATWMSGASTTVATVVGTFNVSGHVGLRSTYFDGNQVANIRHLIWPKIMSEALAKYPGGSFPSADRATLNGTFSSSSNQDDNNSSTPTPTPTPSTPQSPTDNSTEPPTGNGGNGGNGNGNGGNGNGGNGGTGNGGAGGGTGGTGTGQ
ncbi:transglycosylase domain-containing protein [Plantibacter sp. Mn2098]|uniref:transglycosylase domain-containing protein n=1 Tax=Plantibacter sp. Mn2098 TaxID=3395266 RepID=UPI003BC05025